MSLWSLGSNGHSQLSLNHADDTDSPSRCSLPVEISTQHLSISCGGNHTWLRTDSGALYGCGSNEYHQLGITETQRDVSAFRHLHSDKRWKLVGSGFSFSVLVTVDDEIWVTGTCDKGSLGLGPSTTSTNKLERVVLPHARRPNSAITALSVGISHVVLVLDGGEVWGWGAGRKGCLGPTIRSNVYTPALIWSASPENVIEQTVVGKDWTAIRIMTHETQRQWIKTFPHDLSTRRKFPISSSIREPMASLVIDMSANWSTLHCLYRDGKLESHGRRDRSQCGPPALPPLQAIAGGSEHSIGLGQDGKIYVWGWNEHGNCGPGVLDVSWVKTLTVPNDENRMFRGVAAGCGTTFFW